VVGGGFVAGADNAVGVGGTGVGATVGGEFSGVAVGVGGRVTDIGVGDGVDVGMDAQAAATRTAARMSTVI
jgi:hypothetical protein